MANNDTTSLKAAKKNVTNLLGGGNASAGKVVVDLVDEAMASNRDTIASIAAEHTARVEAFNSRLEGFASQGDLEEVRDLVASINQRLNAAAAALTGAVVAHNKATETPEIVGPAQEAVAATAAAAEVGAEVDNLFEQLEARVSALEEWRRHRVEPTLDDHESRISALEDRREPIEITTPQPIPLRDSVAEPESAPMDNPPTRVQRAVEGTDHRSWGNNPFAWGLAAIGLVVGLCVGWWLFQESDKILWGLVAFLFVPTVAAIGFFGGGLIGHRLTQRQPVNRPAEA